MQQTAQKDYKTWHDWVGKIFNWNCAKIKIWPYYLLIYAQAKICQREWDA